MILWRNIENYTFFIILIPTPAFPPFYYMLGGNLGSLLYGDASVMFGCPKIWKKKKSSSMLSTVKACLVANLGKQINSTAYYEKVKSLNGLSTTITSFGEERANLSAIVYL